MPESSESDLAILHPEDNPMDRKMAEKARLQALVDNNLALLAEHDVRMS